jgi:mannitol/fructose-specific phosphotransferase system IIA component (Ntr-type)
MKLSSILSPELIFCGLEGADRKKIYMDMLSKAFEELSLDFNSEEIAGKMIEREDLIMIPYEKGAALPHLRKSEFKDLYIIIGIMRNPVRLKKYDKAPSGIVIMSLISENTSDTYLKALSAFSRYFMDEANAKKAFACEKPEDFIGLLDSDNVTLKKDITADDIMREDFPSLRLGASLGEALDVMTKTSLYQLPVLDAYGGLAGILDASSIISRNIPAHFMMLENVKFLSGFEPFEKILRQEKEVLVDQFIREPECVTEPSTPLIQMALTLAKNDSLTLYVKNKDGVLVGTVTIIEIIQNVLRA